MESEQASAARQRVSPRKPENTRLSVGDIRTDGGTQNRKIDSSLVRQYAALMSEGTVFPPLTIWFDGTNYWLTDGFHRLAAAESCGLKQIDASVHLGSIEDATWDSFSANSQHGLRRKRSDILFLIQRALRHGNAASLSNVEIAKHIGLPETTVRRWRKRLSSPTGEDRQREVTRKGTTYTLHFKGAGKPTEEMDLQQKSKQHLNRELIEIRRSVASPELYELLNAIEQWMAGGSAAEFLAAMEALLTSRPNRPAAGTGSNEGSRGASKFAQKQQQERKSR